MSILLAARNRVRDPDAMVSNMASIILRNYAKESHRVIDWNPMVKTLRALIDGTNLFTFQQTLEILTETHVSPKLASPLVKGGGRLLIAHLRAHREDERQFAHRFLSQLAGRDLGSNPDDWILWIDAL